MTRFLCSGLTSALAGWHVAPAHDVVGLGAERLFVELDRLVGISVEVDVRIQVLDRHRVLLFWVGRPRGYGDRSDSLTAADIDIGWFTHTGRCRRDQEMLCLPQAATIRLACDGSPRQVSRKRRTSPRHSGAPRNVNRTSRGLAEPSSCSIDRYGVKSSSTDQASSNRSDSSASPSTTIMSMSPASR